MPKKKKKGAAAPSTLVRPFKSPIETMMRNALCKGAVQRGRTLRDFSTSHKQAVAVEYDSPPGSLPLFYVEDANNWDAWQVDPAHFTWGSGEVADLELFADVAFRSYRFDLFVVGSASIVIECDGHDWHDRTKQQAAYDRARDRELASLGLITLRCTGSEIHHSVERCVDDVFAVIELHRKMQDARDREERKFVHLREQLDDAMLVASFAEFMRASGVVPDARMGGPLDGLLAGVV